MEKRLDEGRWSGKRGRQGESASGASGGGRTCRIRAAEPATVWAGTVWVLADTIILKIHDPGSPGAAKIADWSSPSSAGVLRTEGGATTAAALPAANAAHVG
jgi:hypothetical protein